MRETFDKVDVILDQAFGDALRSRSNRMATGRMVGDTTPSPVSGALRPSRFSAAFPLEVSYYIPSTEIHPSARKHGVADDDIEHAMRNALAIDDQDDDTRLYLGPARSAGLLEIVTIVRDDGSELAIHAMKMRAKYQRLLPGG